MVEVSSARRDEPEPANLAPGKAMVEHSRHEHARPDDQRRGTGRKAARADPATARLPLQPRRPPRRAARLRRRSSAGRALLRPRAGSVGTGRAGHRTTPAALARRFRGDAAPRRRAPRLAGGRLRRARRHVRRAAVVDAALDRARGRPRARRGPRPLAGPGPAAVDRRSAGGADARRPGRATATRDARRRRRNRSARRLARPSGPRRARAGALSRRGRTDRPGRRPRSGRTQPALCAQPRRGRSAARRRGAACRVARRARRRAAGAVRSRCAAPE